ncbi:MAG: hypothetical protein FWE19_04400 [Oscillospiraceae bacterium]|nr:hypothetical protein [Oscillospiraceae bacterium]
MTRDQLIEQVKEEYANIRFSKEQQHFHNTTSGITPEAYYGTLMNAVIAEIANGKFDNCRSGKEVVGKVMADKSLLSQW